MLWSEAPNKIKYTQKCDPFHNIRDFFKKRKVCKNGKSPKWNLEELTVLIQIEAGLE